jgi:hypothetical protein
MLIQTELTYKYNKTKQRLNSDKSVQIDKQTNKIKRLTWNHSITDPEGALKPCRAKQNKENTNLCLV